MVTLKNGHVKIKQIVSVSHLKTDAHTSQAQSTLCSTMTNQKEPLSRVALFFYPTDPLIWSPPYRLLS